MESIRHTSQAEVPIITYRMGQTTGKTQFGGVQLGFCKSSYHVPGSNWAPNTPAKLHIIIQTGNPAIFFMLICVFDLGPITNSKVIISDNKQKSFTLSTFLLTSFFVDCNYHRVVLRN